MDLNGDFQGCRSPTGFPIGIGIGIPIGSNILPFPRQPWRFSAMMVKYKPSLFKKPTLARKLSKRTTTLRSGPVFHTLLLENTTLSHQKIRI